MFWKIMSMLIFFFPLFSKSFFLEKEALLNRISSMSMEEKVGQLFMGIIYGEDLNEQAKKFIDQTSLGNIIYFRWANGLKSSEQIKKLSKELKSYIFQRTNLLPLIAIDQEGGKITRLKEPFTKILSNKELAETNDPFFAYLQGKMVGQDLFSVGINTNLAPVVDVAPVGSKMQDRSFGEDPERVISFAKAMIQGLHKQKVLATIKHFPGHGRVLEDSHVATPINKNNKEDIEKIDIRPFVALKEDADAIMVGHIFCPAFDEKYCASISYKMVTDLLRNEIGFSGLIISDSLVMKGISPYQQTLQEAIDSIAEAAILAFQAGCDLLILSRIEFSNIRATKEENYFMMEKVIKRFQKAVKEKRLSMKRVEESLIRILAMKENIF